MWLQKYLAPAVWLIFAARKPKFQIFCHMIDTIVFDLGGVLIDWNPMYVYESAIPDPARRAYFFEKICTHDWNIQQDAGTRLAAATEERVALFPEWEAEIRQFYGRWEEMLGGPIQPTVEIFKKLKTDGQHRLLALTNWSDETFPVALERYEFLHWFEGIVVSGTEKTIKPRPDIYQILINRYQIEPSRAVFIDDNAANVAAAEAMGLHGIHFQSPAQLQIAFEKMGVFV